ncbi:MAG: hypothetical protein U5L72_19560 [Bacteroidales bacterium]|nr:hypothetical protein [Bacteroidales bacterium]
MTREHEIEKQYLRFTEREGRFLWLAALVTLLLGVLGLALGPSSISLSDLSPCSVQRERLSIAAS